MKVKPPAAPSGKIKMKTTDSPDAKNALAEWWKAESDEQLAEELCGTAAYLKTNQTYRLRQLAASVRLYSGLSVYSYAGSGVSKMDRTRTLPEDRPTFNLIAACVDTLVSRLGQNEPVPKFLTDGADYKQRHLAEQMNQFVGGEFYQTKAYAKGIKILRDACVMGVGCAKVYEEASKVCVDRVMATDLYVDDNDSLNGEPQQLIQLKLVDRSRLKSRYRNSKKLIEGTPQSYPDSAPDTGRTVADQVMVTEGWRLASGPDSTVRGYVAGRHTIATTTGVLFDEPWDEIKFPFVFLHYSDPFLGFWGKGIGERLFGTQLSINRIMYTIAKAISLVGVPRVFVEQGSQVVKAHNNNEVGVIITYKGIKPSYEVAPCNAPELYEERDKLIAYGFRQEGVSEAGAQNRNPLGADASGEALRTMEDITDSRFAALAKKDDQFYVDLAYLITEKAIKIAERDGKYQTVYPNRDGTKEIDLPKMKFLEDSFVIQCFTESMLPSTPAGRIQKVTEMVQSGMLTLKEGRRLMRAPEDIEDMEKLDNASEERIFQILDKIVDSGEYTPPDPFMDLQLATELTVKYINLYLAANLEESKADKLRTFFLQTQTLVQASMPPVPTSAPVPQAAPQPTPTSPLVPNGAAS